LLGVPVTAAAPAPAMLAGVLAGRDAADAHAQATKLIASAVVVIVGFDFHVAMGASAALPLAVILCPLWIQVLSRYRLATLIGGLAALSVASGLVLAELSSIDHQVSDVQGTQAIGLLMSGIAALVLLLWARTLLPLHRVVLLYGTGALASAFADGDLRWKFSLAMPTALIVLALLERKRVGVIPALAMLGIGILAVADEARSVFGASVLAATLTIWQLRPRSRVGRERRWFPVMLIAGVSVAVYFFTTALATGGALGEAVQQRSTEQIQSQGSLITGGRPEWAATRALLKLNPSGYGVGVVPNWTDRMTGKAGLESINVDVDPFREEYMFGAELELHSVAADLWAGYGWAGVALAVVIAFALARSLSFALAARRTPTYLLFAVIMAFWFLLFGPMFSNWLDVCAALGFSLIAWGQRAPTDGWAQRDTTPAVVRARTVLATTLTGGSRATAS
jgi:hypothetical protein